MQQAVEIVGIDCNLVVNGCHAERLTQVIGDERRITACLGQLAFVDRQQNDMAKIQVTCFQYSHHLHTDGRLSVERNAGCRHDAYQQAVEGGRLYLQVLAFKQGMEAVDHGEAFEQGFAIELVEGIAGGGCLLAIQLCHLLQDVGQPFAQLQVVAARFEQQRQGFVPFQFRGQGIEAVLFRQFLFQRSGFFGKQLRVRMLQHADDFGKLVASAAGIVARNVQFQQRLYEAVGRCLRERETHGDVDVSHVVRQ